MHGSAAGGSWPAGLTTQLKARQRQFQAPMNIQAYGRFLNGCNYFRGRPRYWRGGATVVTGSREDVTGQSLWQLFC